jgi:hypothetical protein
MDEAKAARDRLKATNDGRQIFRGPEKSWRGFPYFSVPGDTTVRGDSNHRYTIADPLREALSALYYELAETIPWEVVKARSPDMSTYEFPAVFLDQHDHACDGQGVTVLIAPENVERLRTVYANLRAALTCAEAHGRAQGAMLLSQLAAGQISAEDFNKKTVLADSGAVAARRVYQDQES